MRVVVPCAVPMRRAVEAWLREAVAEAYDAVEDGSAVLMTVAEVRTSLIRGGGSAL